MKRIIPSTCAAMLALAFAGSLTTGAQASPLHSFSQGNSQKHIEEVQFRRDDHRRGVERRGHARRGFERRGRWGYFNGYRGHREYRRGYRQHNGWWFPPSAFIAGAIIGGALANQPVVRAPVQLSAGHVRWCQNRWRSYRVTDNTYQPYNGPRQVCVSPYGR
jgi:Ni/Co efflux regulator RcnB